ncbi:aspartate racemase [Belliella baltica DSM 15883]|uniref:Aspartate racemase n=2 Tax=Belliella TaxID=232244 RepID=I3Z8R5_BELBD|nr:aspartate racemase [Belliella baltica DSM 15883]
MDLVKNMNLKSILHDHFIFRCVLSLKYLEKITKFIFMKTLGMIGGTSWHSTIEYYRLINELVGEVIGEDQNPPLILHSINIQLMREQNKNKIIAKYLDVAQKLEQAGAEAIIICANTPHMVYEIVQPQINIPILHIAEAIGKEAQKLGLNTLGLLGNKPTMTGDFIPGFLKKHYGIKIIIPESDYLDQSHYYVSKELTLGKFTKEAKSFYEKQMSLLAHKGAEGMIMGCTELPLLIKQEETVFPLITTTQLHAQLAVDFILGLNNED